MKSISNNLLDDCNFHLADPLDVPEGAIKAYIPAFKGGCWKQTYTPEEVRHMIASAHIKSGSHVIVANYKEQCIGGVHFVELVRYPQILKQLPEELWNSYYIIDIWLDPKFHGHGIGDALIERAEQGIVSLGGTQVTLWTHNNAPKLSSFYTRHQYRENGIVMPESDISREDNEDEILRRIFVKDLFSIPHQVAA